VAHSRGRYGKDSAKLDRSMNRGQAHTWSFVLWYHRLISCRTWLSRSSLWDSLFAGSMGVAPIRLLQARRIIERRYYPDPCHRKPSFGPGARVHDYRFHEMGAQPLFAQRYFMSHQGTLDASPSQARRNAGTRADQIFSNPSVCCIFRITTV